MAELEALRARWLRLIRLELPEAAAGRPEWPIRLDHCFARVILDHVCGRPWREVLAAPAYKAMGAEQLERAVAVGEAILAGAADLDALNRESLVGRRKLGSAAGRSSAAAPSPASRSPSPVNGGGSAR
jgi:hypothetical protein